jgi:hypothetical protein
MNFNGAIGDSAGWRQLTISQRWRQRASVSMGKDGVMSDKQAKSGRLTFRLRTMFVMLAIIGIPFAWAGRQYQIVRARAAYIAELRWPNASVSFNDVMNAPADGPPWFRALLGDGPGVISIYLRPRRYSQADRESISALFPEAEVFVDEEFFASIEAARRASALKIQKLEAKSRPPSEKRDGRCSGVGD